VSNLKVLLPAFQRKSAKADEEQSDNPASP